MRILSDRRFRRQVDTFGGGTPVWRKRWGWVGSSDPHHFNDPAAGMVGRVAVVEQAIVGGRGRVTIAGTTWSAQGPDLPAGTRVKITGARETVLVVDPAD